MNRQPGTPLTQEEIQRALSMKNHCSAVAAAKMLQASPETIRRLWRGETHVMVKEAFNNVAVPETVNQEMDDFLQELMAKQQEAKGAAE